MVFSVSANQLKKRELTDLRLYNKLFSQKIGGIIGIFLLLKNVFISVKNVHFRIGATMLIILLLFFEKS